MAFEIEGRTIGDGRCFIIAEAGSNHNGDLATAFKLINVAAESGADCVKFQTFKAKRLYVKDAGKSDYLGDSRDIGDIIASMEMPEDWIPKLAEQARSRGLAFISTPFHEEAVALLEPHVSAFKIASYEMSHHPLLKCVARTGKPVIMSTGTHDLEEVRQSVAVLREAGCKDLVVLQCTASYPAPLDTVNLRAIETLREVLDVPAGLSDHSREPAVAPMGAAALGAAVIEKHFTLSNEMEGPDHAYAVEPEELAQLVKGVRDIEKALGSGRKAVQEVEQELYHFARRSLFTTRAVAAGEPFSRENVDVLRNGKKRPGLPPSSLARVLATTAAKPLEAGSPVLNGSLTEAGLTARPATRDDLLTVFEWANDPTTRANSFISDPIPLETHTVWFESRLTDPKRRIFMALQD
ncbi:MAG: N-acetylneuraminate synthase family protein [Myxococcales bacterium]|nr:N-acetylneuraminate synthase family protein [Myxococcales bacterium]